MTNVFESSLVQAVGWALLHLVWQATLVAMVLAAALRNLRGQAAAVRYMVACAALVVVTLLPVLTVRNILQSESKLDGAGSGQPLRGTPTSSLSFELQAEPEAETGSAPSPSTSTPLPASLTDRFVDQMERQLPLVVLLWVMGVVLSSSRVLLAFLKLRRLAGDGTAASPEWQHALARLTRRIRLSRPVRLLESAVVEVPTVIGWLRPVVLLPVTALTGLSRQQLETILAHELAHVRRHDFIVNLFQTLVETLLFYHPAVWWISAQIRVEREHCCDDLAVELCGNPLLYARALADLEQTRFPAPAPALALTGGSLLHRITRLISGSPRKCSAEWLAGVSVLTVVASLAIAAPLSLLAMRGDDSPVPLATGSTPVEETLTITSDADGDQSDEPLLTEESPDSEKAADGTGVKTKTRLLVRPAMAAAATNGMTVQVPMLSGTLVDKIGSAFAYAFLQKDGRLIFAQKAVSPTPPRVLQPLAPMQPMPAVRVISPQMVVDVDGEDFDFDFDFDYDFDYDYDFDFDYDYEFGDDSDQADPMKSAEKKSAEKKKPLDRASLTVEDLIALRHAGVTPEYIQELERAGFKNLSLGEIVSLAHAGVSTDDIAAYRAQGLGDLTPHDIRRLKNAGVTAEYIRKVRSAGYTDATTADFIRLANAGVDPEDLAEITAFAGKKLTIREVTKLKNMGVDREYANELAKAGFSGLSIEELLKWRAVGMSAEYAREMRDAGFKLTTSELVQLRAAGVDSDFVKELRQAGLTNLSAKELIKLKHAGVDADFIRQMKRQ